ncbi:MAG: hypothetical protein LR015_14190 [Verrucomicrobia bacterium]|nr:hypothetical protein [Verrucomicrobiota bacterium]
MAEHFAAVHHVDPVVMARARFESPMLHFLEGLIQAHLECTANGGSDDAERARVALRMAAEMSPESQTVRNALLLANGDSDTVMAQDRVWVVHENGLAPTLSSVKVAVAFNVPDDQKGMQALALGSMGADLVIPVPVNNPLFGQALFTFPTIQTQAQHLCYPALIISSDEGRSGARTASAVPRSNSCLILKLICRVPYAWRLSGE